MNHRLSLAATAFALAAVTAGAALAQRAIKLFGPRGDMAEIPVGVQDTRRQGEQQRKGQSGFAHRNTQNFDPARLHATTSTTRWRPWCGPRWQKAITAGQRVAAL